MNKRELKHLYMDTTLSEFAQTLEYYIDVLFHSDLDSITVWRTKRNYNQDAMWCTEWGEFVERYIKDSCGKYWCTEYAPRNGKSGSCRHLVACVTPDKAYTLYRDGRLELVKEVTP